MFAVTIVLALFAHVVLSIQVNNIIAPETGDTLFAGEVYNVKWESDNSDPVRISLHQDSSLHIGKSRQSDIPSSSHNGQKEN